MADICICVLVEPIIPASSPLVVDLDTVLANGPVAFPVVWLTTNPASVVPLGSVCPDPGPIHESVSPSQCIPSLGNLVSDKEVLISVSDGDEADPDDRKIPCPLGSDVMAGVVGISPVPGLLNKLVTL